MKIKCFLQLIILFLSVFVPVWTANATLSENAARQWADQKGEQILQILAQADGADKYGKLDEILANDVDLDHAARFAVGRYWREMSTKQQEQYVGLFKRYMFALYKHYPLNISAGTVTFVIDKTLAEKNKVDVWCRIFLNTPRKESDNKTEIRVLFVLVENNGRIQVRDLKIEESSLLLSFRERFQKMIHQDNDDEIDWFIEDLTTIVKDAETNDE